MYFIELIIKKMTAKKKMPIFNPLQSDLDIEYENCEHVFMPIDSTNEILACTKCGILANKNDLKIRHFGD